MPSKRIVQAQKHPHDILHQFRINAIGYDGTEWSGGWTTLTFGEEAANIWRLSGPIHSLHTGASGFGVAEKSGVELVFDRPLRLPMPMKKSTKGIETPKPDLDKIHERLKAAEAHTTGTKP